MLTRFQVQGFKNLADVDVRFGPLTCIAGGNGVGKSNLFDAILFLGALASHSFVEAARLVRGGETLDGLFAAHGEKRMRFAAEMLIPAEGIDEFGQRVEASSTYVRYELELRLDKAAANALESIRLERESLSYITKRDAAKQLAFPHAKSWRDSVLLRSARRKPFISTDAAGENIHLHSDRTGSTPAARRGGGGWSKFPAANLPRTVLSSARNAEESRTAVLVRQEMSNWRLLQLEPSAMRQSDDLHSSAQLESTGHHLPAALYRIAGPDGSAQQERIYAGLANRLAELVEGVRRVRIDRDDARKLLTLMMTDRYRLELPAGALSDGTMRFIALAVLQQDPEETGLLCLEEPENGIHPQRIAAMLRLLADIAVDADEPVGFDNPLRQVIINTHSPYVAQRVGEGDLLFASTRTRRAEGLRVPEMSLTALDDTWRTDSGMESVPRGDVVAYLLGHSPEDRDETESSQPKTTRRRVADRFPEQLPLFNQVTSTDPSR